MISTPIRNLVRKTRQIDPRRLNRKTFTYIDISSIDRDTKKINEPQVLEVDQAPSRARKHIDKNDVLVSTVRPNLNAVAIVTDQYHDEIASTGFCVLRVNEQLLLPKYLYYFTQNHSFVRHLTRLSIGAGYPAVTDDNILDTEIPLPTLPEQKRIATILEKADRLRRLRRYALELGEGYLQSVFLEMFGDPVTNPMGWKSEAVDDICNLVRGSSPRPKGDKRFFDGPVPRLMIEDITRDGMFVTPKIDSLTLAGAKKSRPMKAGSVVMAVSGAVGLPAILKIDACIHDGFVGFRDLDERVSPIFFAHLLQTMRSTSRSQATGAIWQNLTTDQIKSWEIMLPQQPKQDRFIQIVQYHGHLRSQQREAFRQAEHLFQSLLNKAFRGEL
jgi:restriction endonuclease S subunit